MSKATNMYFVGLHSFGIGQTIPRPNQQRLTDCRRDSKETNKRKLQNHSQICSPRVKSKPKSNVKLIIIEGFKLTLKLKTHIQIMQTTSVWSSPCLVAGPGLILHYTLDSGTGSSATLLSLLSSPSSVIWIQSPGKQASQISSNPVKFYLIQVMSNRLSCCPCINFIYINKQYTI